MRGTGMSPTRRRNHRRSKNESPEALAARLPDELRSFGGVSHPNDFQRTAARVAAWLDTQAPGTAEQLTYPVMQAAGMSVTDWYKAVFAKQAKENRAALAEKGSN